MEYLNFPKTIPIYFKGNSDFWGSVEVPVEFRYCGPRETNYKIISINNNILFSSVFKIRLNKFNENFFQIICNVGQKKLDVINNFYQDIGRAISVGEKNFIEEENIYEVGGILSRLFNAVVSSKGEIFCENKRYKVIILYSSTFFSLANNKKILIEKPVILCDNGLYIARGKFSVQLKKYE